MKLVKFAAVMILIRISVRGDNTNKTLNLGLSIPWEVGWKVGGQIASAMILGLKEIKKRQLLHGYEIEWIWRDSYCQAGSGMAVAVDMWESVDHLDGIIGDGCSIVCQPQALLAAAWNIQVVAYWCSSHALSDKSVYPTFSRVEAPYTLLGPLFKALAQLFSWRRVAILHTPEDIWSLPTDLIKRDMESWGNEVIVYLMKTTGRGEQSMTELKNILISLKKSARIIYTFAYQSDLESIYHTALREGMLNGEYIFINLALLFDLLDTNYPYASENDKLALEGIMGIYTKHPSGPEFEEFLRQVVIEFQDSMFDNVSHVLPNTSIEQISLSAGKPLVSMSAAHTQNT